MPFLLFFPAIMVAARYGGVGPGVFVMVLSVLATAVRYLDPMNTFGWNCARPIRWR